MEAEVRRDFWASLTSLSPHFPCTQLDAEQQYLVLGQSETPARLFSHLTPTLSTFILPLSQYPFLDPAPSPQPANSGSHDLG